MDDIATGRDGVVVDDAVHNLYQQLTEGSDPLSVPFRTMKDVFLWAASLGCREGRREPLTGRRVTIFRWAQFAPQTDLPLLKAMAIASEGVEALSSQDRILAIAEEFANAGIHELHAIVVGKFGQQLWNLLGALDPRNDSLDGY